MGALGETLYIEPCYPVTLVLDAAAGLQIARKLTMKSFLAGALLVPTAIASLLSTSLPLIVNAQQSIGAAVPGRTAARQAVKEDKNLSLIHI